MNSGDELWTFWSKLLFLTKIPDLHNDILVLFVFPQKGPADIQNIDPEFTREMVPNSVGRTPEFASSFATSSSNAFNGFSYASGEDGYLWECSCQ